jgi:hypothetical protein
MACSQMTLEKSLTGTFQLLEKASKKEWKMSRNERLALKQRFKKKDKGSRGGKVKHKCK